MVTGQKIALGRTRKHQTVTVLVSETTLTVEFDDGDARVITRLAETDHCRRSIGGRMSHISRRRTMRLKLLCRIEPYLHQGGGAARRRWPGSRAGLCRGAARPAPRRASLLQRQHRSARLIRPGARGLRWTPPCQRRPGSAVCLVLVRVPHPLWIVPTDDGPVNPS